MMHQQKKAQMMKTFVTVLYTHKNTFNFIFIRLELHVLYN